MQRGPDGEDELVGLFADDAVYLEPFGGGEHVGRDAIRAWLRSSWPDRPPGIRLTVERLEIAGQVVEATWTCEADVFARPARGRDRFTIHGGRIARLETELLQRPEMNGG